MRTVLLVEDVAEIRAVFQLLLEELGHRVLTAENGVEGFLTAAKRLPDLIVTDWTMPELDGVGLCERLKKYPALALIPVVMVSALPLPVVETKLWDAYLRKPVTPLTLKSKVKRLLARRFKGTVTNSLTPLDAEARLAPVPSKCWP
ncbi:response regulator [Paraburkholderia bryophila]|uniref:CheY-like chemotaxis protein n=1 Tax=Paraburkholderia bryophila TaxID=420952 RepID=A0A7Y9WRY5_9BURK|nr:response regulator [Paraburkholderia bryophila]NYH26024.1 CheY-like chemotaxis protein [Paraburkholderia bryophila]